MKYGSFGFTLIELLVSLAIMAVLATAIMPLAQLQERRYKERRLEQNLLIIRQALDAYKQAVDEGRIRRNLNESGYPHTLNELVDGVSNQKNPDQEKIYFLRRIPRDPTCVDKALPADKTWGLRSYASPANAPSEGKDVFDVYSKTEGEGLNGIPYREW